MSRHSEILATLRQRAASNAVESSSPVQEPFPSFASAVLGGCMLLIVSSTLIVIGTVGSPLCLGIGIGLVLFGIVGGAIVLAKHSSGRQRV